MTGVNEGICEIDRVVTIPSHRPVPGEFRGVCCIRALMPGLNPFASVAFLCAARRRGARNNWSNTFAYVGL